MADCLDCLQAICDNNVFVSDVKCIIVFIMMTNTKFN